MSPEYCTWRFSFTILPYYSTILILSKNFQILSSFNVNEMGSHWVLLLLYFNFVLSWPEDGRSRPKHVAKCNIIVLLHLVLMYVVYWGYIIYYTKMNLVTCRHLAPRLRMHGVYCFPDIPSWRADRQLYISLSLKQLHTPRVHNQSFVIELN